MVDNGLIMTLTPSAHHMLWTSLSSKVSLTRSRGPLHLVSPRCLHLGGDGWVASILQEAAEMHGLIFTLLDGQRAAMKRMSSRWLGRLKGDRTATLMGTSDKPGRGSVGSIG